MSSSLVNDQGQPKLPMPNPLIPFKWEPITPHDHRELIDCVGIVLLNVTGSDNDLTVRWHDGELTTLDFGMAHASTVTPHAMMPMLPAFIMATDTDFAAGHILGAFLGPQTIEPNRSPRFTNLPAHINIEANAPNISPLFVVESSDPDYDEITYSTRGSWDSHFSLDDDTVEFRRGGSPLNIGDVYELTVGAVDAAGVNTVIEATLTITVIDGGS